MTHRDALIKDLFDTMNSFKRTMQANVQVLQGHPSVSRTQQELLFSLQHLQPISFKALAEHLQMTPGAVSQLVEGLEMQALVERTADKDDRRKQYLRVSKKGDKLIQEMEKHRRHLIETVIADLTDTELETWLTVQKKMSQHFQALYTKQSKKEDQ